MSVSTCGAVSLALLGTPFLLLVAFGAFANSSVAERMAWRQIRRYCEQHGCSDIAPMTNSPSSFGVWFVKGDRKYRGKCSVLILSGQIVWEKNDPAALPG
jgi:hypothetical protein